ncbi:MAG: PDR/VanB family oxidoreductase [Alphaproteobacteria bacterium]|nr:PDR/VanB family oxidoreductase [Alphaproteobacteria bacterium]
MSETLTLTVDSVTEETGRIRAIVLSDPSGGELPPFEAGSHIDVHMTGDLVRQYSLMGDPEDRKHYRLGVLLEEESRGGSQWIFDHMTPGMTLAVSQPRNNFPLHPAKHSILIGGGIGVTPLLSMARVLDRRGDDFTLYYLTRGREQTAFLDEIGETAWADQVKCYHRGGDPKRGLDLDALLKGPRADTQVYCCGPTGLMTAVRDASAAWDPHNVHFEWFSVDPEMEAKAADNAGFEVEIKSTGQVFTIGPDESIADVLQDAGLPVETSCCEGVCGACITPVLAGMDEIDHRDSILTDEERDEEGLMTLCCSRSKGGRLVLDL